MANFTDSITVRGEEYDYDPNEKVAQVPCEECGFLNEVDCVEENGEITFYSFSCENCGHFNSSD